MDKFADNLYLTADRITKYFITYLSFPLKAEVLEGPNQRNTYISSATELTEHSQTSEDWTKNYGDRSVKYTIKMSVTSVNQLCKTCIL